MQPNERIMNFKESRRGKKKTPLNITVETDRLNKIESQIKSMFPLYGMMNRSEQIDFCLMFLEMYMFPQQSE
jgi:hypothetical protein